MNNNTAYAGTQVLTGFDSFMQDNTAKLNGIKQQQMRDQLEFDMAQEDMQEGMNMSVNMAKSQNAESFKIMSSIGAPTKDDYATSPEYAQRMAKMSDEQYLAKFGGRKPQSETGLPDDVAAFEKLYGTSMAYQSLLPSGVPDDIKAQIDSQTAQAEKQLVNAYQSRFGMTPEDAQATADRLFAYGKQGKVEGIKTGLAEGADWLKEHYWSSDPKQGVLRKGAGTLGTVVMDTLTKLAIFTEPAIEAALEITNVFNMTDDQLVEGHPRFVARSARAAELLNYELRTKEEEKELNDLTRKLKVEKNAIMAQRLMIDPLKAGEKKAKHIAKGGEFETSDVMEEFVKGVTPNKATQDKLREWLPYSDLPLVFAAEYKASKLATELLRTQGTTGASIVDKLLGWFIPGKNPIVADSLPKMRSSREMEAQTKGSAELGDTLESGFWESLFMGDAKVIKPEESVTARPPGPRTPPPGPSAPPPTKGKAAPVRNDQQKMLDRLNTLHRRTAVTVVNNVEKSAREGGVAPQKIIKDIGRENLTNPVVHQTARNVVKDIRSMQGATSEELTVADRLEDVVRKHDQVVEETIARGENPLGPVKAAQEPTPVSPKTTPIPQLIHSTDWVDVAEDGTFTRKENVQPYIASSAEEPVGRLVTTKDMNPYDIRLVISEGEQKLVKAGKGVKREPAFNSAKEPVFFADGTQKTQVVWEDFKELGRWLGLGRNADRKQIYAAYVARFPAPEGMPAADYFRSPAQVAHISKIINQGRVVNDNLKLVRGTIYQPDAVDLVMWFRSDIADGGKSYQELEAATRSLNRKTVEKLNKAVKWTRYPKIISSDPLAQQRTHGTPTTITHDELMEQGANVHPDNRKGGGGFPFNDDSATVESRGITKASDGRPMTDVPGAERSTKEYTPREVESLQNKSRTHGAEGDARFNAEEQQTGKFEEREVPPTKEGDIVEPEGPVDILSYAREGMPEKIRVMHLEDFTGSAANAEVPMMGGAINVFHISSDNLSVASRIDPGRVADKFRTTQLDRMAKEVADLGADADKMVLFNRGIVIQAGLDEIAKHGKISRETSVLLDSMDLTKGIREDRNTEQAILAGIGEQYSLYKPVFQQQVKKQMVTDTNIAKRYMNTGDHMKADFVEAYVGVLKSPEAIASRAAFKKIRNTLIASIEACK